MDLDYYRSLYDAEWARRDQIVATISLPAGLLALLAGGLVVFVQNYTFGNLALNYAFVPLASAASMGFLFAIYYLLRAYFGPKYQRIPWPSEIHQYERELTAYYAALTHPAPPISKEVQEFLLDKYIAAADRNSVNNVNAGAYLFKAMQATAVSLVLTLASSLPFVLDQRQRPEPVTRMELVGQGGFVMPRQDRTDQTPQDTNSPAEPAPVTPQRPTQPTNKDVRTGVVLPKPE